MKPLGGRGYPCRWDGPRIRSPGVGGTQKMGSLGKFYVGEHSPKHGSGDSGADLHCGKDCGFSHSARTRIMNRTQDRDGLDTEHKEDIYCRDWGNMWSQDQGKRPEINIQTNVRGWLSFSKSISLRLRFRPKGMDEV